MNMADLQSELIKKTGRNISQQSIAIALGTTRQNINARIKNYSELSRDELEIIQCKFNVNLINYYDSNFIKQLRIDHALSREELANMLEVSLDTIIDIEMLRKPIDNNLHELIYEVFGAIGNGINSKVPSDISIIVPFCEKQDNNSLCPKDNKPNGVTFEECDDDDILKNFKDLHKRYTKMVAELNTTDYFVSKRTGISESRLEKIGLGDTDITMEEFIKLRSKYAFDANMFLYNKSVSTNCAEPEEEFSAEELAVLKKLANKIK